MPRLYLVLVALLCLGLVSPAQAAGPEEDLAGARAIVQKALAAAQAGDLASATAEYRSYDAVWSGIEDPIRAKSRESYREIEARMADVENALAARPVDQAKLAATLAALDREQGMFVEGKPPTASSGAAAPAPSGPPTMALLLDQLSVARAAEARGDYATAAAQVKGAQDTWLDVEGQVKTRSADDYRQSENDLALAYTQLGQGSPEAAATLDRLSTRLEPYRVDVRYGVFDATVILLREGLEALLAFLRKSGNAAKAGWIWGGAGAGVAASLAVGVLIQLLFASFITPSNRELIEGVVGLVAAAMLLYVSYWLHSKSNLGAWQQYLSQQTTTALASGSVFGLAVLSFLAVFREGAETVLFFLGMTGNISAGDLALGLAIGAALLGVLGVLMLVVGVRVPMRPFFAVAGLLVFYLCFKFTGTGVHALQVGGMLPATASPYLPEVGWLGISPTWESTIPQVVLLLLGLSVALHEQVRRVRPIPAFAAGAVVGAAVVFAALGRGPAPTPTAAQPTNARPATPAQAVAGTPLAKNREVAYVRTPRPHVAAALDALKRNDAAAARRAMADFESTWNGVEVYVNVRSRELYNRIEAEDEKKIDEGLAAPQPKTAELVPLAEDMLAKYDEAINLSETGPALSPLFDDVTALRVVRTDLRKVGPALKANDVVAARAAYASFDGRWHDVEDLIKARSTTAYRDIEDAMKKAGPALSAEKPSPAEAGPLVDALVERYNYGLSLVNAAARGADRARSTYTADDVKAAVTLGQIEAELRGSLPLWEAGKLGPSGEHARRAGNELFDAASGPLRAKAADANLKKALDAYVGLADKAGDAAKVRAANKSAVEAVAVAQQSLVGQFWAEPALHGAVLSGLLAALKAEAGKPDPTGAWGLLQVATAEQRLVEPKLKTAAPGESDAVAKAFGTLAGVLPEPDAPAPAAEAVGAPVDAATAALKAGLKLP